MVRPINEPNNLVIEMESMPKPLSVGLLLGSHAKRQKDEMKRKMEEHVVDILVGTHALIQGDVNIPDLALAVVDEEHRFGVAQRGALVSQGRRPHLISMSATPIPRSLALTFYGDMDISVIDELPPGRTPNQTRWLRPDQRDQANRFIRKEVTAGHQVFVVCPLIDESDSLQTSAALEEYRRLSEEVFTELQIGLIHGRMNLKEKSGVMKKFRAGDIDVLVATPVVEVGVDIPNATIMMVEGADRFGLSALHQLRGRVGRSDAQGYCILMADNPSEDAQARLSVMEQESDGFRIAEEDLKLRGPGELTGTRQSGLPDMKLASLQDTDLLSAARQEANAVLLSDGALELPEHKLIAEALDRLTSRVEEGDVAALVTKGKSRA
jgi:ATP-dependent DNA helicase RecG